MVERRPVLRHDKMVCFDDGADRFHMRAAAIAIRNGRVLIQNIAGGYGSFLPGGRIEQNEPSPETLVREMQEEFGQSVEVGHLAFVVESFYPEKAQQFHEVGLYYRVEVPEEFPYLDDGICHRCYEGPVEMEYRWVPATPESLAARTFYPEPLRTRLGAIPLSTVHILDRAAA